MMGFPGGCRRSHFKIKPEKGKNMDREKYLNPFTERKGDELTVDVTDLGIDFRRDQQTGKTISVVTVKYNVQDREKSAIINPRTGQADQGIQIYKNKAETFVSSTDELVNDLCESVKIIIAELLAKTDGVQPPRS
jgi:hypothetical protein